MQINWELGNDNPALFNDMAAAAQLDLGAPLALVMMALESTGVTAENAFTGEPFTWSTRDAFLGELAALAAQYRIEGSGVPAAPELDLGYSTIGRLEG